MTRPISALQRTVAPFQVKAPYQPSGDQPAAIAAMVERIRSGEKDTVLLGATGTGKSATTAWLVEALQRPTLVMAPNKTLAAQLAATPVSVPAVIVDLPLLARRDAGAQADAGDPWVHLDAVIVIDVPEEMQFERAVQRGMAEQDVRTRMSRQASRTERLAIADYVIDNSGTMDETRKQVHEVWDRVLTR